MDQLPSLAALVQDSEELFDEIVNDDSIAIELENTVLNLNSRIIAENRRTPSTRRQYDRIGKIVAKTIRELFPAEHSMYLVGDMLKMPLPVIILDKVMTSLHLKRDRKNGRWTMKSTSSFNSTISVIKYMHEIAEEVRDAEINLIPIVMSKSAVEFCTNLSKGRTRIIAQLRGSGHISDKEGKTYLSFKAYCYLAERALTDQRNTNQFLLAHAFIILAWNLMARSKTVAPLLWNDLGWVEDCLTITYETSKTNQEGDHVVPRHLFANPLNPVICPVLALALKLVCECPSPNGPAQIFPGNCANNKFSNWLTKNLTKSDRKIIGCSVDDIGSHSLRKGGATYVCGIAFGPNPVTVSLRMDHSIGKVDDKYIHHQAGSDKCVGRCVTGLNFNSTDFAILPPYFVDMTDVNFDEVVPRENMLKANESFRSAIPFLVASIIYHWDWLAETLPSGHPLFFSAIWTQNYKSKWGQKVKVSNQYCPITRLTASGLPPTTTTSCKVQDLTEEIEELKAEIKQIPIETCELLLSKIDNVQGISICNRELINAAVLPLYEEIRLMRASITSTSATTTQVPDRPVDEFKLFCWGGAFHFVPKGFSVPHCSPKRLWILWIFGDSLNQIRPYRYICGKSLSKQERCQLSKARFVMDYFMEQVERTYDQLFELGPIAAESLFVIAQNRIFIGFKRINTMNVSTAYGHIKKIISTQ